MAVVIRNTKQGHSPALQMSDPSPSATSMEEDEGKRMKRKNDDSNALLDDDDNDDEVQMQDVAAAPPNKVDDDQAKMEKLKQIIEKVLDEHSQSDPTIRTRWDGLGHTTKVDRVGLVLDECTQVDDEQSFESGLKKISGEFLRMLPLWQNSFLVSTQSVCVQVSLWTSRNSAPESSRSRMDLTETSWEYLT
jgi:hypothetical protein